MIYFAIITPLVIWALVALWAAWADVRDQRMHALTARRLESVIAQHDKYSPAEAAYWNAQRWD